MSTIEEQIKELELKREYTDSWELSYKYGEQIKDLKQKLNKEVLL